VRRAPETPPRIYHFSPKELYLDVYGKVVGIESGRPWRAIVVSSRKARRALRGLREGRECLWIFPLVF